MLKKIFSACAIALPLSAFSGIDCDYGNNFTDPVSKFAEATSGLLSYDFDGPGGAGLLPKNLLLERAYNYSKKSNNYLSLLGDLRLLCNSVANKDPVEQYFSFMQFVFGKIPPYKNFIGIQVEMGRGILNEARILAEIDNMAHSANRALPVVIRLEKRGWLFNSRVSGAELSRSVKKIDFVIREGLSYRVGQDPEALRFYKATRDTLVANSIHAIHDDYVVNRYPIFLRVYWENGQISVVPLINDFYDAGSIRGVLVFNFLKSSIDGHTVYYVNR